MKVASSISDWTPHFPQLIIVQSVDELIVEKRLIGLAFALRRAGSGKGHSATWITFIYIYIDVL